VSGGAGISPKARAKLAVLAEARRKWGHLRALVEQAMATSSGTFGSSGASAQMQQESQRRLMAQIGRMAGDVDQMLGERGFGAFTGDISELAQLARRGGRATLATMSRMREVVSQVSAAFDIAERDVAKEDEAR
jgi:hypothetical protein